MSGRQKLGKHVGKRPSAAVQKDGRVGRDALFKEWYEVDWGFHGGDAGTAALFRCPTRDLSPSGKFVCRRICSMFGDCAPGDERDEARGSYLGAMLDYLFELVAFTQRLGHPDMHGRLGRWRGRTHESGYCGVASHFYDLCVVC
jgi:hypothetical protein